MMIARNLYIKECSEINDTITSVVVRKVSVFKVFLLVPINIKYGLKTLHFSPHCTNYAENKKFTNFATPFIYGFCVVHYCLLNCTLHLPLI